MQVVSQGKSFAMHVAIVKLRMESRTDIPQPPTILYTPTIIPKGDSIPTEVQQLERGEMSVVVSLQLINEYSARPSSKALHEEKQFSRTREHSSGQMEVGGLSKLSLLQGMR